MGAKKKNPSSNATKERKVAPVMEEADIEETIDYVATADRMIRMASSPGDPDDQDDEDFDDADDGENDDHDDEVDGEDDEDEDAEDDEDEDEDVDAKMGAHDNNEEEDDDDDDESVEEVEEVDDSDNDEDMLDDDAEIKRSLVNNDISIPGDEPCTFDLRNLLGASAYPVDSTALYIKASAKDPAASDDDVTIPRPYAVNEAYLLTKAVAGCNQIVSALWQLPVERTDAGPMVQLPTFDESKIPRALVRFQRYLLV